MRSVIENSIIEFVEFFDDFESGNRYDGEYQFKKGLPKLISPFKIYYLTNRESNKIEIYPNVDENESIVEELVDRIVDGLNDLPRVEMLLFQTVDENQTNLRYLNMVSKDEKLIVECKKKLHQVILANSHGPNIYKSTYSPFKYLLSNDCENDVEKFLKKERSIKECKKQLDYLLSFKDKAYDLSAHVAMNLYLIDCTKINEVIIIICS
jgi:hypothetical protein